MPRVVFPNGTATPSGAFVVIQVMDENGQPLPGSLLADFRFAPDPAVIATDWPVISICHFQRRNSVYAAGQNGEVIGISDTATFPELIAPPDNGPPDHGPIREIRDIGDRLYAVGMGRQVYRRAGEGVWERMDAGILDTTGHVTAGLTSIAGDGAGFLVTVGYDGEIWELHETWQQIDSPTNLLLNRVVGHDQKYYAAGMIGTLLCREPAGWRTIDVAGFEEDIWDLESFGGVLYIGTANGLFFLTPDETILPIDRSAFTRQLRCTSLSAGGGRLWCFGADIISSTPDGKVWREEPLLSQAP